MPSEKLQDYIKCYWEFQIETFTKKCIDIVPDGFFDLVITIQDMHIVSCELTGIWDEKIQVPYFSSCKHIGVRFKPIAVQSLFKQSIGNFLNGSITFDTKEFRIENDIFLNPDNTLELYASYFNKIFEKLLISAKTDHRRLKIYKYIDYTEGNISVDELSCEFGLSNRQLHRIVSHDLGINPKTYIQIVRVLKMLKIINENNLNPENSFFDQSHLIKNVKRFTGLSPKEFVSSKNVRFIQF